MVTTTNSSSPEQTMEELHEQIAAGNRDVPSVLSSEGRRYRQWRRETSKHEKWLATQKRRAGGIAPVRGEKAFGAARSRGFTGRNSGYAAVQDGPEEWQTTTNLGAGFNPNTVGAPSPVIGVPIGRHVTTGSEVAVDPMSWFREGIIANPSCFVLSLPGLGKSTLIRKMLMGTVAAGQIPIVAGDIKAEYVGFVHQVGGQVITIGHGIGHLNPLDVGALGRVVPRLIAHGDQDLIDRAKEQVHGRQVNMIATLVGLMRSAPIQDYESMIVSAALRELYDAQEVDWEKPPILRDLIALLEKGSVDLYHLARARDEEQWNQRIDALVLSLNSLLDGATGRIFDGQTTTPINVDSTAVCIDVSAIDRGDKAMKAAVMMATWSSAFGAIEASNMLADAGLEEQKLFSVTLDELWQTLSAAPGMVGQTDELTRLNRSWSVALLMITHTFKDLEALPTEEDRKTAMGFIDRAGMVICGGLPTSELETLSDKLWFSKAEAQMITSWSRGAPPKRARTRGANATPPGRGRFMIKPSKDGAPGIPVQTILFPSEVEYKLHDTNARFEKFFAEGAVE